MAQFDGMDSFTKGYIVAALWSSTDDDGEPLDGLLSVDDISADTVESIKSDCADFQEENAQFLGQYKARFSSESAGHDFWLTRNRHGAGFWDRGLDTLGRTLTASANAWGGVDLYIGDDGMIHQA